MSETAVKNGVLVLNGIPLAHALAGFAGLLIVVIFLAALQRRQATRWVITVSSLLRIAAFAFVLLVLTEPTRRFEEPVPQDAFLVHAIDVSESMGIADMESTPRLESTQWKAGRGSKFRDTVDVLYHPLDFTFDESLDAVDENGTIEVQKKGTDIAQALRAIRSNTRGMQLAGAVIYSDGNPSLHTDRKEILAEATQLGTPIYTVGSAPTEPGKDFWIDQVIAPQAVYRDTLARIAVIVKTHTFPDQPIVVRLEGEGFAPQEKTIQPDRPTQNFRVEFDLPTPQEGIFLCRATASSETADSYPWNNEKPFFLEVEEPQKKILYFEGYPRPEYRFLRAAFSEDERFKIVSVLRVSPRGRLLRQGIEYPNDLKNGFPDTREELFQYNVIVLGDVKAEQFSEQQIEWICDFVRVRGGGLLLLAGKNSFAPDGFAQTALAETLPFHFDQTFPAQTALHVLLTAEGKRRAMFGPSTDDEKPNPWDKLPALEGLYSLGPLKPGATPLCAVDIEKNEANPPVVVWQSYGLGRTMACGIEATWPWKFHTSSSDPAYSTFWKTMTLILTEHQQKRLQIDADPVVLAPGESVTLEGIALNEMYKPDPTLPVTITATLPNGERITVETESALSAEYSFRAILRPTLPGVYAIHARLPGNNPDELIEDETRFLVLDETPEFRDVALNDSLLRDIADASGGEYFHVSEISRLPENIHPPTGTETRIVETPVWDSYWIFFGIVLCLFGEWSIRRLGNLS